MKEEFNLSKRRWNTIKLKERGINFFNNYKYHEEDVKEFIKRLKEEFELNKKQSVLDESESAWIISKIDKFAGEKLV